MSDFKAKITNKIIFSLVKSGVTAIALAVTGFLFGYYIAHDKAKTEYESKLQEFVIKHERLEKQLEEEQKNIKEVIVTEYVDRVKIVKEKENVYITQIETVVPTQCDLSSGWVHVHDSSSSGNDADTTRAADDSPSGVTDNRALRRVVQNYSICQQNAEQLRSLQEWIKQTQASVENANR